MAASYDRREEILARLLVIAQGITGVVTAARNQDEIGEKARPAILILDADEQVADPPGQSNHRGRAGVIVSMTPELYLMLGDTSANVGTAINALRAAFVAAVMSDSALDAICGTNGHVRYQGCATGLARGRNMEASMGVSFTFTYPLFAAELADA